MSEYQAPVRDMQFVMHEVFEVSKLWASLPAIAEVADKETADAILEEAAKLMGEVVAPLNRESDEKGSSWKDGVITEPKGFKHAYELYCEGGWNALGGDPAFGGMGMPKTLTGQVEEMLQASGISFGLLPMLTAGAALSINSHATDELKEKYLPNMYAGTWAGAMDLTESHAGTDLGIIRSKAVDNGDGSFAISGTKIFITWGEHEMAENIIHLVLAKLPDAPSGPKGISLFLVPKFLVNEDGSLGERNDFSCGSIEKKMGIKASATCVMNFDGAKGWLVGEPNQGLACMFTMMNYERLVVGIQALGAADRSYQNAATYACDRVQSRGPAGVVCPDKMADPIIVHPDVRRMLLDMRAQTEGARAFSTYVASWLDRAKYSENPDEKKHAEGMTALLTPVTKAFISDKALETAIKGQQVFGGHGFIREWGQEQLVRDIRITQIYEGANGIHGMDLLGRKVVSNGGRFIDFFVADINDYLASVGDSVEHQEFVAPLREAVSRLQAVTANIIAQSESDPYVVGAVANDYLHLFGLTAYAYMWTRMAVVALAQQGSDDFYTAKLGVARFFFQRQLPQTLALEASIASGSASTMALDSELF